MVVRFIPVLLLAFAPAALAEDYSQKDYCKLKCFDGRTNIACNNDGQPAAKCGSEFKLYDLTQKQKDVLLDNHNKFRRQTAVGEMPILNGTGPQGANMRKLVWDDELAYIATFNVKQCKMAHDCASTEIHIGQNIFWYGQSGGNLNIDVPINKSVTAWKNENVNTPESYLKRLEGVMYNKKVVGHFTQVVWADTWKVGCAVASYRGKWIEVLVTCNYGRGGNFIGNAVYQFGEPCSKCPKGTVCEDNLCAATS